MLHQQRWTQKKIKQQLSLIEPLVYRHAQPLPPFYYRPLPDASALPPVQPEMNDSDWLIIKPGSYWGEWQTNFILRSDFKIPSEWAGQPVAVTLPLGDAGEWFGHPEALVFVDGFAYAGCDRFHQEILLDPAWNDGRTHTLLLHGWTGNGADPHTRLLMRPCQLVSIHQPTRDFTALTRVALGVVEALDDNHPTYSRLLNALDAAFCAIDTRQPFEPNFYDSIPVALTLLRQAIAAAGEPVDVTVTAAGHSHIDVAWLWTLAQTRRKAGRTFHTVIRMMEQFPDYCFTQSQPQLYDYVRQDYPALFETIKTQVQSGRWETIGGMWVEADCNLSGGEALARQFLLGRTFFRRHFGPQAESPVLWLPDVFGYAGNLPQLIKLAGLEYFFTIKIGWSQYNKMPYDTFWWQGLDGTQILTHFSPIRKPGRWGGDYNASATPAEILEGWRTFKNKETSRRLLMAYGYGDGGGGPTREMQENLREMESFPGLPRVQRGKVIDFFRAAEKEAGGSFPVWNGELYLELHRGTYTTQARNKRANRQSEFLLHDAEFLAAVATLVAPDFAYPHADLHRAWELVCLNQFHDIIPGSSISQVYVDSLTQYAEVRQIGEAVQNRALTALAQTTGGNVLLINPTSFAQTSPVFWPEGDLACLPTALPAQPVDGGLLFEAGQIPPYSIQPLDDLMAAGAPGSLSVSTTHLENDFLRVELTSAGDISRIFDKQNRREVMPPGAIGNLWQAFEDRPLNWDAWDIDIFYDDKQWLADPAELVAVVERGPLRAALEIRRRILNSPFTQRVSLHHNSRRLDFETVINWHERHILLKTAFPVEVLSPSATYEIQWGNVERPTHRNTSWDWAKFETCAHKWVDLSEGDYGVSLLNDCKYGHDIQDKTPNGSQIRLTLLRSSTHPDPEADQGEHCFTYSLLPHAGRWGTETIRQAYILNDPLRVFTLPQPATDNPPPVQIGSFVSVDRPNVVIETIKQAEDDNGIIVRLYECMRQRGPVTLHTGFSLAGVWRTNLLEENETELPHNGNSVAFSIRPYQIVTLRLLPKF